jgi:hypothetical protein
MVVARLFRLACSAACHAGEACSNALPRSLPPRDQLSCAAARTSDSSFFFCRVTM